MDDSQAVGVKLLADEDLTTAYGRSFRPVFWIVCHDNTTEAYFDFGTPISTETREWESDDAYGYRSGTPLRLRLDKEPAFANFGNPSTDYQAAYLSGAIPILKQMIGHATLLVEYTPLAEAPRTAQFTIQGIGEAMQELRKSCSW